jgi:hypothetical protein
MTLFPHHFTAPYGVGRMAEAQGNARRLCNMLVEIEDLNVRIRCPSSLVLSLFFFLLLDRSLIASLIL